MNNTILYYASIQSEIDGSSETDPLKQRISELEAENSKIKAENVELKARVAKLEEDSRQLRKDSSPEKPADISDSIVAVPANSKPSEEKTMDSFLDEVNKKRVSDEIRQRKREEKLAKVETVSPEKDKQVSVDKRALRKEKVR